MDDKKIIALYFARDERAIEETKANYGRLLFSIAENILHSTPDSEECESDTYMSAWEAIPPTMPEILSAYLAKITRNLALNRLRDRGRRLETQLVFEEMAEAIPDMSGDLTEDIELRDALNDFIGRLDRTKRKIFLSRYFYMRSVREIAREIGATEGSVKVTLTRVRKMLREYLTKRGIVI